MLTYIDGIHDEPTLFYRMPDGKYVPFTKVETAVISDEVKNDPDFISPSFTDTGELYFTGILTKKSSKGLIKLFRKIRNKHMRCIRSIKRAKEKHRRAKLKTEEHTHEQHQ